MYGVTQWTRRFSAELKRRGVYRVGGLYLASAFIVLQAADLALPALALPEALLTVLVLATLTGFPIALVLAWAFDITAQRPVEPSEGGLATDIGARLGWAFAGVVTVTSLGLGAGAWWLWIGGTPGDAGPGAEASAEQARSPKRIAVLYFDDISPDGSLGYLATGLTEGLIHELSLVEGLEVVSRNGVKPFRDHAVPMDSIVRALGSGSLVEGSVSRSGDRLKLTVQLIDGVTGVHLESRVLERDWGELFALQDSLTVEVARGLRLRLGQEVRGRATQHRASSVQAWSLLQRAQVELDDYEALRLQDSIAAVHALLRGDSLLVEAQELDPGWVDVAVKRAEMAGELSRAVSETPGGNDPAWAARALAHAERAVELASDHPGAFAVRGTLKAKMAAGEEPEQAKRLRTEAEADLRKALDLDYGDAKAWWTLSRLLLDQGKFADAARAAQHALEADAFLEVASSSIHELYYTAINLEEFGEACRWCDEGRRRFPEETDFILCQLFLLASAPNVAPDVERAWSLSDSIVLTVSVRNRDRFKAYGQMQVAKVLVRAGQPDSARAVMVLARGQDTPDWLAYDEAHARLLLGERGEALRLLARYVVFDPSARGFLASDWWFRPLWEDPDYEALVDER